MAGRRAVGRGPALCLSLETSVKLPEYTCICGCHSSPLNSPSEGAGSGGTEAAKNWGPASGREGRFSRAIRALPLVCQANSPDSWPGRRASEVWRSLRSLLPLPPSPVPSHSPHLLFLREPQNMEAPPPAAEQVLCSLYADPSGLECSCSG